MAEKSGTQAAGQSSGTQADAMAAARAAKGKQSKNGPVLSQEELFSLQNVRLASKACKMVSKRIQSGKPVPSKVLEACSSLAGSLSEMLYS